MRFANAWRLLAFGLITLSASADVFANGAPMWQPPRKVAQIQADVEIEKKSLELAKEPKGVLAKITIPLDLLRAELKRIDEKAEMPAQLPATQRKPANQAPAPPASQRSELSPRTIIAGLAMSLAAVSLIFVARRGSRFSQPTMLILAGVLVLGTTAAVTADIAVPGAPKRPRDLPPDDKPAVELAPGREVVIVEIVEGGFPREQTIQIQLRD